MQSLSNGEADSEKLLANNRAAANQDDAEHRNQYMKARMMTALDFWNVNNK